MGFLFVQWRCIAQIIYRSIDAHARKAGFGSVLQQLDMFSLARAHYRGENHQPRVRWKQLNRIHHLIHRLLADLLAALRAMRGADARVQQAQIVMDLGHCADSGARVMTGGFLVDGDRRRKPPNGVYIGFFHLPQKLARIAGHAFHIAALAFCVYGIKGQRRLAGSRQACKYNQTVARQDHIYIFQVVLPRSFNNQGIAHGASGTNTAPACAG